MRSGEPRFVRRSLRAKVAAVTLATTFAALAVGCSIFLLGEWRSVRGRFIEQRVAVSRVLAANAAAPVVFHDAKGAADTLSSVRDVQSVRSVYLYDADDHLVATYDRGAPSRAPTAAGKAGWTVKAGLLSVAMPVQLGREQVGKLVLVSGLEDLRRAFWALMAAGCASLLAAGAIAFVTSLWLARAILRPLSELARGMAAVRASGDTELRVRRTSEDEVGGLTDEFNALLRQLAANEHALRDSVAALTEARDAAEAATLAKSQFLANMSHEIRTPLNGVVGIVDALSRTALDNDQREMVEIVRTSGDALQRLLSDVLDLSRIESGRLQIESRPFDLAAAVKGVAGLTSLRAEEKGVAFALDLDPACACWVLGDELRIKQILINLISNAVKFTERGEVRLTVEAEAEGFRFTVSDTGVGFDAAQKERLFGRFQQADNSITRRFGGTGLGLAISMELAALMGGVLDCDAAPGEGARFWASLPLPRVDRPVAQEAADKTQAPDDDRPLRVLLADDHPVNRRVVELMLQGANVELTSVEDGRAALEAFCSRSFDVVLMDMQMPVMDGLTATREIRREEARLGRKATPVIMLTANAGREYVDAALESGADAHLAKPITASALLSAMEQAEAEALSRSMQAAGGGSGRPAEAGKSPTLDPRRGAA